MAEPRLTKILISIVFIGVIALAFQNFLGAGVTEYGVSTVDNSTFQEFISGGNDIENIVTNTTDTLDSAGASDSGLFDIVGAFFGGAWSALKTTSNSIETLNTLAITGVSNLPFINSAFAAQLILFITTAIIIVIVIGIFIHFFKPSNRL